MGAWIETALLRMFCTNLRSLPSWERGLKHSQRGGGRALLGVAPFVGAWIETHFFGRLDQIIAVAPFVGAWIETNNNTKPFALLFVAPFVGAWIETGNF